VAKLRVELREGKLLELPTAELGQRVGNEDEAEEGTADVPAGQVVSPVGIEADPQPAPACSPTENQPVTPAPDPPGPTLVAERDPNVTRLLGVLESALKAGDMAGALEYLERVRAELRPREEAEEPALRIVSSEDEP
jgi:hypothetical protein